jgi:uncharacterized membrane protein YkvI
VDKADGERMTEGILENQIITQTVMTPNMLTGVAIGTFQEDFQLCEADFLRLRNEGSMLSTWSLNILFAAIGFGMSILPKWISEIAGKPEKVSQSEWAVLAIGIAISVLLFLVNKLILNEKKELLKRMANHFKSAPKTRQFVRGQK